MDTLESLMSLSDLRLSKKSTGLHMFYDKSFDCLQLMIMPPETDTAVYFVDKNVGLIYTIETKEIVGIQIEDFVKIFLPIHASLNRAWRLSYVVEAKEIKDFGEIVVAFEENKPIIAREVIKASEIAVPSFGKKWREFEQLAMANA